MEELFTRFIFWMLTAALGGLCFVAWKVGDRIVERVDALEGTLSKKYDELKDEVHRDLGRIKERISRVEGAVWPLTRQYREEDDPHK